MIKINFSLRTMKIKNKELHLIIPVQHQPNNH